MAELFWGVRAVGQSWENIAEAPTAEEVEASLDGAPTTAGQNGHDPREERSVRRIPRHT